MINAVYGTFKNDITIERMENWKTQWAASILSEGIFISWLRSHKPNVSVIITTINAINRWIWTPVLNTIFNRFISFLPNSKVRYRCVLPAIAELRTENIATTPPTTLYTPKSVTPNCDKTTLLVYRLIPIARIILIYKNIVFLAIRLLSIENWKSGINALYQLECRNDYFSADYQIVKCFRMMNITSSIGYHVIFQ